MLVSLARTSDARQVRSWRAESPGAPGEPPDQKREKDHPEEFPIEAVSGAKNSGAAFGAVVRRCMPAVPADIALHKGRVHGRGGLGGEAERASRAPSGAD